MIDKRVLTELLSYYAKETPDSLCIKCENRNYSYRDVEDITNGIAAIMVRMGATKNCSIGIIGQRTELIPFFILSILKIGARMVPLNNSFPKERIKYICSDASVEMILADENYRNEMSSCTNLLVICFSIDSLTTLKTTASFEHQCSFSDVMAIYYTSGTSGPPKGVVHTHQSVMTSNYYDYIEFGFTPEDCILLYTHWSICFSITAFAVFYSGGSICISSERYCSDLLALDEYVSSNKITVIHMPTQVGFQFSQLSEVDSIRLLILGGSSFPKLPKPVKYDIINVYGSTEGMALAYQKCNISHMNSSLGIPAKHSEWIIVDNAMHRVDYGCPGELLIASESLSTGYLNSAKLNQQRYFLYEGKRVFNTKDIVRKEQNGTFTFLGRADRLYKIRGQRVDVTEIEDLLLRFDDIRQCCINGIDMNGNLNLCAYIISSSTIDVDEVKRYLGDFLPEYMIPTFILQMDSFPLSDRGKINFSQLPLPSMEIKELRTTLTSNEELLSNIATKILGIDKVSLDCSFRELGGDSLNVMVLYAELREHGLTVTNNRLLLDSQLSSVAANLRPIEESKIQAITNEKEKVNGLCRYVIKNNDPCNVNKFIIHEVLHCINQINVSILRKAIECLTKKHPILKCIIESDCSLSYLGSNLDDNTIIEINVNTPSISDAINGFLADFNITNSLFRVLLIHHDTTEYVVLGCHHLISDGISKKVLVRDFCEIYKHLSTNEHHDELSPRPIVYISHRKFLLSYFTEERLTHERVFWEEIYKNHRAKKYKHGSKYDSICKAIYLDDSKTILQKATSLKYGLLTISLKSLYQAIDRTHYSRVVQVIKHGRISLGNPRDDVTLSQSDLYNAIGCFAFSHPVFLTDYHNFNNIENYLESIPNEGIGFDVLGNYLCFDIPTFGIDVVGNNDQILTDDYYTSYFEKAKGIKGIQPISTLLDMGCPFLLYIIVNKGRVIIQARYDTSMFSQPDAEKITYQFEQNMITHSKAI